MVFKVLPVLFAHECEGKNSPLGQTVSGRHPSKSPQEGSLGVTGRITVSPQNEAKFYRRRTWCNIPWFLPHLRKWPWWPAVEQVVNAPERRITNQGNENPPLHVHTCTHTQVADSAKTVAARDINQGGVGEETEDGEDLSTVPPPHTTISIARLHPVP